MSNNLETKAPEWYTPSPTDILKKVETVEPKQSELAAPSIVPQVHLIPQLDKQVTETSTITIQELTQPTQLQQQPIQIQQQQQSQQVNVQLQRDIPILNARDEDTGSIHIIKQEPINKLNEGSKLQGDKFKSELQNRQDASNLQDWRTQPLESKGGQSKIHGDALFESRESSRQFSESELTLGQRREESLTEANFGKLRGQEEERSRKLNGNWDSKDREISKKNQGDSLFNSANSSSSQLGESSKIQGDKLLGSTGSSSFTSSIVEGESRKIQGDKMFDSTGRQQSWGLEKGLESMNLKQDELPNANFGRLQAKEEEMSKRIHGDFSSQESSAKTEGDALFNSSERSTSSGYVKLPLNALRSNSDALDRSWSPSIDRGLKTFDEQSEWNADNLEFEPVQFSVGLAEIKRLEEVEREDRIKRGVDPVLMGKVSRFQHELLHHNIKFIESLPSLPQVELPHLYLPQLPDTRDVLPTLKEKTLTWSAYLKENVLNKTRDIYAVAKEGLGYYDVSSIKSEEKERVRRMGEKVDPMIDARKRRVEEELLHSVKSAN